MARHFEQILTEMRGGKVAEQLSDELAEIVSAVQTTGKAGELTLKLSIKPCGDNQVEIEPKVNGKAPRPDVGKAIFFVDSEAGLSRRDPNQPEIPFGPRPVEQGEQ